MRDWKIGRLFMLVTSERPDVTVGNDDNELVFYGATRTTKVNIELVDDARDVRPLASLILAGLNTNEPQSNPQPDRR